MRRHKKVAQIILLIFSVINFALAAPISVRGIAEDMTTASGKRYNPSDEWASSADRMNTPARLGLSDSDHWLEQELRPHDSRSPLGSNPPSPPQPGPGSTDSDKSLPLPAGSPPPAHNNLPDLNDPPQPIEEPADSSNFGSYGMGPKSSSDASLSAWLNFPESPSSPQPHGSNPPPAQDIDLNRPLSSMGPTDDQPPLALLSDPRPSKRPSSPPDPGPSKRPYIPSDPEPSTSALGPLGSSGPGASTSSSWVLGPSNRRPPTWALGPLDPGASTSTSGDLGPELSTWELGPSYSGPPTWALGPSDPGPSTRPYRPLNPGPSASDPGLSTPHPPPAPEPLHESEIYFSELFKGSRFKRHISDPRSVNAAQRELQDTVDSREYVSVSAFPPPRPSYSPSHKHPDFELLQLSD
jgi:hypothetical protein